MPEDICVLLSGSQHSLAPHAVLLAQDKQLVQARPGLRARDGGADWLSRMQTPDYGRNQKSVPDPRHKPHTAQASALTGGGGLKGPIDRSEVTLVEFCV